MIHDAQIEVTCDGERCRESIYISLHYFAGGYDATDDEIERKLKRVHEWTVIDGKHYCSSDCAP